MPTTQTRVTMSPESLAHHLHIAAEHYDADARIARSEPEPQRVEKLAQQLDRQAAECRVFAAALGDIRSIGFDSQDRIEVETLGT
jgi:hypothetical protein